MENFIASGRPAFALDPLKLAAGEDVVAQALAWAKQLLAEGPSAVPLVYATSSPASVKTVQGALGPERAGALVEEALAAIARGLWDSACGRY